MTDKQIIANLTAKLEAATKPKWVSVSDRLPEEVGKYLCHFSDGTIETYDYQKLDDGRYGITDVGYGFEAANNWHVTHWQSLPPAPEVK